METQPIEARLVMTGTLVYKDKDGNVVGTAEITIPLDTLKEEEHGNLGSQ